MNERKRIAVVGSGISGLTCCYLLAADHDVTLFEANETLGGHTATVDIELDGNNFVVDTGFIVFNDRTYPNFCRMMEQIGVGRLETEMSFSVHNEENGLEYNGHSLNNMFAQRRNLFSFQFNKFIYEIIRFNLLARRFHQQQPKVGLSDDGLTTIRQFLQHNQFSDYFADNYILPMVAAIWSSSLQQAADFPLLFFIRFFENHGLLDLINRPQWYVIDGGSRQYIPHLIKNVSQVYKNCPVTAINRQMDQLTVEAADQQYQFDEVIVACHSDQALQILADPTEDEISLLSKMPYRNNNVDLHTDGSVLPTEVRAHASWNYWIDPRETERPYLSYYMNKLQHLNTPYKVCVSLNQAHRISSESILDTFVYSHPVFSSEMIAATQQRERICGINHTHFCGAYWYNGFHEDGVRSALDVCQRFGATLDKVG